MTTARIHLHRSPTAWSDRARSYKLLVDGAELGTIRHGEDKTFDVPAGKHTVQMKIDWGYSQPIELDLAPGQEEHLTCRGRNPFGAIYWSTIGRKKYIVLERGSEAAAASAAA